MWFAEVLYHSNICIYFYWHLKACTRWFLYSHYSYRLYEMCFFAHEFLLDWWQVTINKYMKSQSQCVTSRRDWRQYVWFRARMKYYGKKGSLATLTSWHAFSVILVIKSWFNSVDGMNRKVITDLNNVVSLEIENDKWDKRKK